MDALDLLDAVARLLAAAGLGAALGLERELNTQPAGFRTHLLVAVGSALFTLAGVQAAVDDGSADPTRIAAQVVTGIGFLGAGAILRERGGVKGLTTAASLWVTAAVGLACGLGQLALATVTTVVALLALAVLKALEHLVLPRHRPRQVVLHLDPAAAAGAAQAAQALLPRARIDRVDADGDSTVLVLQARVPPGTAAVELVTQLRALPGVRTVELGP